MTATDGPASPLLDKADALMRRHRSFVAIPATDTSTANAPDNELPVLASAGGADEDIPLLTEVVDDASVLKTSAEGVVNSALTDQQKVVRAAIERWVDESLPDAILHVLDGFTDRLIAAVSDRARSELLVSLEHSLGGHAAPEIKD